MLPVWQLKVLHRPYCQSGHPRQFAVYVLERPCVCAEGEARGRLLTLDADGGVAEVSERAESGAAASTSGAAAEAWGRGPHEASAPVAARPLRAIQWRLHAHPACEGRRMHGRAQACLRPQPHVPRPWQCHPALALSVIRARCRLGTGRLRQSHTLLIPTGLCKPRQSSGSAALAPSAAHHPPVTSRPSPSACAQDPAWRDPAWQDPAVPAAPAADAPADLPAAPEAADGAPGGSPRLGAPPLPLQEGAVRIYTFGLDDGRCRQARPVPRRGACGVLRGSL